jgi:hypothetical protein
LTAGSFRIRAEASRWTREARRANLRARLVTLLIILTGLAKLWSEGWALLGGSALWVMVFLAVALAALVVCMWILWHRLS